MRLNISLPLPIEQHIKLMKHTVLPLGKDSNFMTYRIGVKYSKALDNRSKESKIFLKQNANLPKKNNE